MNPYNQKINFYDETLPEILRFLNCKKVKTIKDWESKRRKEILELFEKHMYGISPKRGFKTSYKITSQKDVFNKKAIRKQITLTIKTKKGSKNIHLLFYLPKMDKYVPVFCILNFHGNHTLEKDKNLPLMKSHVDWPSSSILKPRGEAMDRMPIEKIVSKGFGVITACKEEFNKDINKINRGGVQNLFASKYTWGSIAIWAWGLSRMADFLETQKEVDKSQIISMGLSRLGKASLWAGAQDERFNYVISINSGGSGASLTRCKSGETIKGISNGKPFWFCSKYKSYKNNEKNLPIDQHMLISLIAPRYVYVTSSEKDAHANPKGEFLSCVLAEPIFKLYNKKGLGTNKFPKLNSSIFIGNIGYHIRTGEHGLNLFDWIKCIEFIKKIYNQNFCQKS